jgi:hypothetical protein
MDPDMCMNTGTQTWGLAAIDDLDANQEYYTEVNAGDNVHVYVLDTGFYTEWEASEFPGRVDPGISFIAGEEVNDLHGHGTHCAGTIGSLSYGVAKETTIVPVKVLSNSGSGSSSAVNNGMAWVDTDRIAKGLEPWQVVVSMSLGGGYSSSQNDVANALVDKGITVVVAAGNDGSDACRKSPASAERVITVMASDSNNNMASFSNYGQCADIIAPGVDVLSTISNMQTAAWSGTSMACPHVAGIVATMQSRCGGFSPEQVWNNMLNEYNDGDWGLYDRIGSIRNGFGGTRNLFVQSTCSSGCAAAPAPPATTGGPTTTTENPWQQLLRRLRGRFGEESQVGAEPEAKVAEKEEIPEVQEEVAAPTPSPHKKFWSNYKHTIIASGLFASFCLGMVTQRTVGKPRGDVYAQLVDDEI